MPSKEVANNSPKKTQQLKVVVRIRPRLDGEHENDVVAHKLDEKMVLLSDPLAGNPVDVLRAKRAQDKQYVFDWTFDGECTQKDVYEKTTKALVENVIDGYNGTVFAYGATGAGKTYTMVGDDDNPGIMVRALRDLFSEVDKEQTSFQVAMSYLEIYNELIRDLLCPSPGHLELREDAKGNHQVIGLSETKIATSQQVMSLLKRGNRQRTQEPTGANHTSSRSHALLVVRVKRTVRSTQHEGHQIRTGSLYMVDLAGSERAANTQNTGKRLVEGAHINKSLLALGNCINALAERNVRYVNFRDSKLTRLLKEPLTGNCRTIMVAHVSPHVRHYEETRNTLVYADRAKNITTKLRSNVSDVSFHVAQYQSIITELRQEIQCLKDKIKDKDSDNDSFASSSSIDNPEKRLSDSEMKELKKRLVSSFNMQMEVRRRMMEIDSTLLGQSIEFDKLNMIINQWETERVVTAVDKKELDKLENIDDLPDPVRQAWDDLQYLKSQQDRYLQMRDDCETDYEQCKENTHQVTDTLLAKKASTQEQRELLDLLVRVYDLEVEKMELQSSQLIREHELRYRDLMLRRYDRQRQLCDDIITRQRQLIDAMSFEEKNDSGNARKELDELYRIYQQELQDLNNGRDSSQQSSSNRSGSASGLRPLGTSGSMMELHQIQQNPSNDEHPLPPIHHNGSGDAENEQLLFKRSRPGPPSQNSEWTADRRSDSSDWSVKSHMSSDSPRLLPPLDKNPAEMPPKYVNEIVGANARNRIVENNTKNFAKVNSVPFSPGTNASDKRSSHMGLKLDGVADHKVVEGWKLEMAPLQEINDGESSERPLRPGVDRLSQRYGLLPSLRRVEMPRKFRSINSDSETLRYRPRQKPTRRPVYQSPEIETRNRRNRETSDVQLRRSYDGYYSTR